MKTMNAGKSLLVSMLFAKLLLGQTPEAAHSLRYQTIIDLTHTLDESTPTYEDSKVPVYQTKTVATIEKEHYFAREICLPEHFGTHLDAPAHFAPGHWTLDQIPPERLLARMVVLDVSSKVKGDPDYRASMADVTAWEKTNGQIPAGAVVILRTGWESRWNSAKEYRNADSKGVLHFPGYSLEAVKLLVEQRKVYGLGIDTLSVDYGPSPDFTVHQYSLAHDIYHLENLANLSRLPARGSQVVVAPMKLAGGSGSPARVLALIQ